MKRQRDRLLKALQKRSMTTNEIRITLGIGMPATRVFELKEEGYDIATEMVPVINRFGEEVRVAKYSYRGKIAKPAEKMAA